MLPAFEIVHRLRPVALVAWERTTGFVAPYAAVETELGTHDVAGRVVAGFRGPGGLRLEGWYDGGRRLAGLDVTDAAGRTTHHRSRRHGRPDTPPEAIATTLTGRQLTVLTRNDGTWTARARVDLTDRVATGDPEVLAGLEADTAWLPRAPGDRSPVTSWRAGTFGQLGVRDVGLVTESDGTPVERDGLLFLTMTHAGPGFFDTAHTGVWSFDPETLAVEHRGDLYLRRGGLVLGDHAVHLVRDGDRWLLASSTWGDFDRTTMAVTLATSTDDLLDRRARARHGAARPADRRPARPGGRHLGPAPGAGRRALAPGVRGGPQVLRLLPRAGPGHRARPARRLGAARRGHRPARHRGPAAAPARRRAGGCWPATAPATPAGCGSGSRCSTWRWPRSARWTRRTPPTSRGPPSSSATACGRCSPSTGRRTVAASRATAPTVTWSCCAPKPRRRSQEQ